MVNGGMNPQLWIHMFVVVMLCTCTLYCNGVRLDHQRGMHLGPKGFQEAMDKLASAINAADEELQNVPHHVSAPRFVAAAANGGGNKTDPSLHSGTPAASTPEVTAAPSTPAVTPAPATPKVTAAPSTPAVTPAPATPKVTAAPSTPAVTPAPSTPAVTAAPSIPAVTPAPATPKVTAAPSTPVVTPAPATPKVTAAPSAPAVTPAPVVSVQPDRPPAKPAPHLVKPAPMAMMSEPGVPDVHGDVMPFMIPSKSITADQLGHDGKKLIEPHYLMTPKSGDDQLTQPCHPRCAAVIDSSKGPVDTPVNTGQSKRARPPPPPPQAAAAAAAAYYRQMMVNQMYQRRNLASASQGMYPPQVLRSQLPWNNVW